MALTEHTPISAIAEFSATTIFDAFPGLMLGGDVDDEWLWQEDFARISTPSDYTVNPLTQTLVSITPTLNQTTHLWDAFAVQSLTTQQILVAAVTAKIVALGGQYATRVNGGFNYGGHNFQIDDASALEMSIVKQQIGSGIAGLGYWVDTANVPRTMDDAAVVTFIDAAYTYAKALKGNFFTKRAALMNAQSQADIDAVDITAGWPSN